MRSPFQFGREVAVGELVDRETELREVLDTISERARLFLIGPRRFGKTSILTTAAHQARARGDVVVQVNAERYASLDVLAAEIIRQAGQQLRTPLEGAMAKVKRVFAALNPQISYSPLDDSWSVSVTAKSVEEETGFLADALNSLDALAAEVDQPVALIIDEFQQVVAADGLQAERQLRAVVQRHRNVGYVFAGSEMAMLMAMTGDHARPFYRLGARRFLGPVPREDFREHVQSGFAKADLRITDVATERILDLARDVPYSVQRLSNVVWRSARLAFASSGGASVEVDFVETEFDRLLEVESPQYGADISMLTPAQRKALAAIQAPSASKLTSSKTARRFGLAQSTLRRAVGALETRSILRRVYDGDPEVRYAFEDPFFGEWVRRELKY